MTTDEKVSQLTHESAALPRLGSRVQAGKVTLEAGRACDLRLEQFEGTRDADVRLA